jgi:hypothetical protein
MPFTIERLATPDTIASKETFAEAQTAYVDAVAQYPGELVMLCHSARVVRKRSTLISKREGRG